MILLDYLRKLLMNPRTDNYIVAAQIPTVICLVFQSYQAYKLGLKEFRLIAAAWIVNLVYLGTSIYLAWLFPPDDHRAFVIITIIDLANMYLFLIATIGTVFPNPPKRVARFMTNGWLTIIFLLAGVSRCIPGSFHLVPYIHLRYVPGALLNVFVLFVLAFYFRKIAGKMARGRALAAATMLFALDQLLAMAQRDEIDHLSHNDIIRLDNFGFVIGLVSKLLILIFLSLTIAAMIQQAADEEKTQLLKKIQFAVDILNMKRRHMAFTDHVREENEVLLSVLAECLNLVNERSGYYATYDEKTKLLKVLLTSETNRPLPGTPPGDPPVDKAGVIATAIATKDAASANLSPSKMPKTTPDPSSPCPSCWTTTYWAYT